MIVFLAFLIDCYISVRRISTLDSQIPISSQDYLNLKWILEFNYNFNSTSVLILSKI